MQITETANCACKKFSNSLMNTNNKQTRFLRYFLHNMNFIHPIISKFFDTHKGLTFLRLAAKQNVLKMSPLPPYAGCQAALEVGNDISAHLKGDGLDVYTPLGSLRTNLKKNRCLSNLLHFIIKN